MSSLPERDMFEATISFLCTQKARIHVTSRMMNTPRLSIEMSVFALPADVVRCELAHWNSEQKVQSQDTTVAILRCLYGPAMQLILHPAD